MVSIQSLQKRTAERPPVLIIYGAPGIGKTSLACEFPDPVMLRLEDGIPMGVEVDTFPILESFSEVLEALYEVYTKGEGYKTIIIDSISEMQRLVFEETCARGDEAGNRKSSIEGFGYGKGYLLAKNVMQEFLEAVEQINRIRGVNIVMIAHAAVQPFNDPESESYDRWTIDLHKQLSGMVERHADGIFLVKTPIDTKSEDQGLKGKRAIASGTRVRKIYTEGSPSMIAKNRFGMPADMRYDKGKGYAALAPYLPAQDQPAAAATATATTDHKED